jgi:hypothetical protein
MSTIALPVACARRRLCSRTLADAQLLNMLKLEYTLGFCRGKRMLKPSKLWLNSSLKGIEDAR